MQGWENFFFAEVGASAALAGLIFVGVSINLNKILSLPTLPSRAFEALLILLTVLVVSSLLLVPKQPLRFVGVEVLVIGLGIWLAIIYMNVNIWRHTEPQYRPQFGLRLVMNQLAVLPYMIAGVTILLYGRNGLYWLVPAIIFSFIKAFLDAWVLLVEIKR